MRALNRLAENYNDMSRPNRFAETLIFSSPIDCVRRKMDFGEVVKKPRSAKTDSYTEDASNSSVRRRLDFGETDPSVLLVLQGK